MKYKWIIIFVCSIMPLNCMGKHKMQIGLNGGRLTACPSSPNCVSSQSQDRKHYIDPIKYQGDLSRATDNILTILKSMDRVEIVKSYQDYIYVQFTSRLFRFVDDVEFCFDDKQKIIHMRSASRIGYSDLGANRKRLEKIREIFNAQVENK